MTKCCTSSISVTPVVHLQYTSTCKSLNAIPVCCKFSTGRQHTVPVCYSRCICLKEVCHTGMTSHNLTHFTSKCFNVFNNLKKQLFFSIYISRPKWIYPDLGQHRPKWILVPIPKGLTLVTYQPSQSLRSSCFMQ
jgi:hypothetical protein